MTLVWALISITVVLILSGIYTVNRSKAQDSIEFEGFNVKLKTKNAGIAMIVFGLIPIPIAISQVPQKKAVVTAVTLATQMATIEHNMVTKQSV